MNRSVGIDVLRGVAVALVVARHAWPEVFPGAGVVGVVMFFALSGHLITSSLVAEHGRTGAVSLRGFYVRRARRLVPALLALLVGFTVVVLTLDPLGDRGTLPATWLVALTWTANLPLGLDVSDAAFHLWTLAGEEQFYLLWPAVLLAAWRSGRVPQVLLGLLVLAAGGIALTALWLRSEADLAYALPTSWVACFVLGSASALVVRREHVARLGPWVSTLAAATLLVLSLLPVRGSWWTYTVVAPLVAVLTLVLVQLAVVDRLGPRVPAQVRGAMAWLGRRSYAAYLWNYPLALWLRAYAEDGVLPAWAVPVLLVVLTLLAAELSWHWVEQRWVEQRWVEQRRTVQPARDRRGEGLAHARPEPARGEVQA